MPRSMTAFARNTIEFSWGSVTCELRSVNHRFLETGFRLPETMREIEMPLREIARKALTRGKVDCSLHAGSNQLCRGSMLCAQFLAVAFQFRAWFRAGGSQFPENDD